MHRRLFLVFLIMLFFLTLLTAWNICTGSVNIPIADVCRIMSGNTENLAYHRVIWNIRLPRIIAAIVLGGALSVSGFLLQTFFNNPIAGPYVLGISSGAKLSVALTMIFFLDHGIMLSATGMVLAAFAGAMISLCIVMLLSLKVHNMSILIVCGILLGYICSAITDFFVTFANDSNIVNLHNWAMGSFSGIDWADIKIITTVICPVVVLSFMLSKPIGAYQLGERYAKNMGVNILTLRVMLILLSSMLSACVTAFTGPISFVGIAVPHLVKSAAGTAKPLILIPACFLGGALITLFCDGIARSVFSPAELSISSVTALFLVPVVIYMMFSRQGRK
ncbi:MAG: iron ABC transporter permease [Treponema sp.]|nr:iron ABC transporter permease [Treponema sp.]